jgi:tetratricopeptide (TPR) repeat protein
MASRANAQWMLTCAGALLAVSAAALAGPRIIEAVDVVRTPAHIDVTLLFSCQVRYAMHTPPAVGTELRLRLSLGPDCGGTAQSETLQPASDREILESVELAPLLANDVDVAVRLRREEKFVLLPTSDQRGMRIRLLRPGREAPGSRVVISEAASDQLTAYAINLDSAREPFDAQSVARASELLGLPAYVSGTDIDGVHWHRLRLGPIATRSAAERKLLQAQVLYPRAWLAAQDETVSDPSSITEPVEAHAAVPIQAPGAAQAQTRALYDAAREQFRNKDYDAAIELLTKLLNRPFTHRAEALELLGLARERNGQLAHAKAEYEAYLRQFPAEPNANRVRRRLHALRSAALTARAGGPGAPDDSEWRTFGGVSQYYRRDDNHIRSGAATADFTSQNALLNDFDAVARHRGLSFDTVARISAGYRHDLLPDGPGNPLRVSAAFVELSDRDRGWSGRLGRQSRASGGLLGTFDGCYGAWPLAPHLTVETSIGFPVESSREPVQTQRLFEALSIGLGVFDEAWEPGFYFVNQSDAGRTDRRAVGMELRYFRPGRVVVGFADYDLHFQELNSLVALASFQAPWRWTVSVDLEHRKSPVLTTRNALIGQPVADLDELFSARSDAEVRQLALDRSAELTVRGLSLARPVAERFQLTINAASIRIGATPPSGGVEGLPSSGTELVLAAQLIASSIMRAGDIHLIALRRQSGGQIETSSAGIASRVPVWGNWRLGPQLRVDRRRFDIDDTTQWIYTPSLRLSLQKARLLMELEGGTELAVRQRNATNEDIRRYFVLLGYRYTF